MDERHEHEHVEKCDARVNVVNVGERRKNPTFTTYPYETKRLVNVVNVVRGYFALAKWAGVTAHETRNMKTRKLLQRISQHIVASGYHKMLGLLWDIPELSEINPGISQKNLRD
jgi:hypothetical protein